MDLNRVDLALAPAERSAGVFVMEKRCFFVQKIWKKRGAKADGPSGLPGPLREDHVKNEQTGSEKGLIQAGPGRAFFEKLGQKIVHNDGNAMGGPLLHPTKFTWKRAGKYMARKSLPL